ncbi:hypothetical protein HNQ08_002813 [Deinococcus humi]|uniref:Uncharacterized protein n=1 Tax=Deinococcus humi TaxID=662880 RepID=A0A7W8NH78_9DEIO|nr:hypothetical protein [Deinococcus humi]
MPSLPVKKRGCVKTMVTVPQQSLKMVPATENELRVSHWPAT